MHLRLLTSMYRYIPSFPFLRDNTTVLLMKIKFYFYKLISLLPRTIHVNKNPIYLATQSR